MGIGFGSSQSFSPEFIVAGLMILKHSDRLYVVIYLNPYVICT